MRSDEQIRDDILEEIDFDPKVESTDIGVTVKDGAVTLHGTVHNYFEELAVIKAAKRVKGVHAVVEEIKIKFPSDTTADDKDIAERIASLCGWNTTFRKYDIKAEVKNGRVSLSGAVDWQYQRTDIRDHVSRLRGVTGVTDSIVIRPHASQTDVKRKIVAALHRSATLESSKINVEVVDGTVTLKGHVKAWYERQLAENAAWSAPGVTKVVDQIQIS